jgi:ABC-2 type transport system ATP-binding protein
VTAVLEFDNIVRAYSQGVPVLNGVSFTLHEGEVAGLLGRNGAGKTTLIQIAMGMLYPNSGSVRAFGLSPRKDAVAVKRRIGYVAEEQILPGSSSVAELIAFHRHIFPQWDGELEGRILDRFGLSVKSTMMRLSNGEARAVALLCAICHRPELLLLDEPAAGLDPAARREFLEVAVQFLNREGTTILFSSHYMDDIERIGQRAIFLDAGKVSIDSAMDRLRDEYSLALVPIWSVPDRGMFAQVPGCLRVREVFSSWHVVLKGAPEDVEKRLGRALDSADVRVAPMTLEELFVELMGGGRGKQL